MIKKIFLSIVLLGSLSFSQENSIFTSLTGLDDTLGVTHLYYRSGSSIDIYNPVYHFIPGTPIDSAFIDAYIINYPPPTGEIAKAVLDFNFYKRDPEKYLAAGFSILPDNHGYIERFDGAAYGGVNNIDHLSFSSQNHDLMYANAGILLKSSNGGITWQDQNRPAFPIISLSPLDDKVMFGFGDNNSLIKSLDSGNTYFTVDTASWDSGSEMYFDPDGVHIYLVSNGYNYNFMKLSTGGGEPFSWVIKKQSDIPIYLSNDSEIPGLIFYANGKNIYKSNDFGITFNLYKTLERNIVGIYKKPNEDKLYAATKYKIYEVTNDSMIVIKSLPVDPDILDWHPLAVGDKWIYKVTYWSLPDYDEDILIRTVVGTEVLSNGREYFKIEEKYISNSYMRTIYERIDSSEGLVYEFDETCTDINNERMIDDLLASAGDSILIQYDCFVPVKTFFELEDNFQIWGMNSRIRIFSMYSLISYNYDMLKSIGLYSLIKGFDFGSYNNSLNGCVIDGIVYGDTTVTDVNEDTPIPKEFALYQNFPNPFNPGTTIDYDLPVSSHVSLKIFDILGREIETLVDEFQQAGNHSAQYLSNAVLPSGVYFYQLAIEGEAKNFISVKKMMLLK
jgi:hypothetical protein